MSISNKLKTLNLLYWRRFNFIALAIFWVVGAVITYFNFKPYYFQDHTAFWSAVTSISLFFYIAAFFTYGLLWFIFRRQNRVFPFTVRTITGFLLTPLLAFPLIAFVFEVKFAGLMLTLLLISLILQRADWDYISEWLVDLKASFLPHLKKGYHSFLQKRSGRVE